MSAPNIITVIAGDADKLVSQLILFHVFSLSARIYTGLFRIRFLAESFPPDRQSVNLIGGCWE
jgi:hypothetical protein